MWRLVTATSGNAYDLRTGETELYVTVQHGTDAEERYFCIIPVIAIPTRLQIEPTIELVVGENRVDQNREQLVKVGFYRAFRGMPERISVLPVADAGTYNLEAVYAR